jgi:predicted ferric reductase
MVQLEDEPGANAKGNVVCKHLTDKDTTLNVVILLDPVLHFGLAAALVPFAATWKTGAIAAGVVGAWLSLALAASFRLRKWIGQKGWRRLHYASFAAFALSLGHALLVGTDLRGLGGPLLALVAAGPVLWLTFYRLLVPRLQPGTRTAAAPTA